MKDPESPVRNRPVRDRDVIVTAALVIAAVLIIARVTGFVPALDDVIGLEPVVIIGLVTVTIAVLVIALRPRSG